MVFSFLSLQNLPNKQKSRRPVWSGGCVNHEAQTHLTRRAVQFFGAFGFQADGHVQHGR